MILAVVILSLFFAHQHSPVVQTTTGWCSPNFNNIKGNISVTCVGVDPQALLRLNAELRQKKLDLAGKIREADQWATRYRELTAQLSARRDGVSKQALAYLRDGKLSDAESLLEKRLLQQEKDVDGTAENHFSLGLALALQFRIPEAASQFEECYRYRPANSKYVLAYAETLIDERRFADADAVLGKLLSSEKGPQGVQTGLLAATLNLLATLYLQRNQFSKAEEDYRQALTLYRELAGSTAMNPETQMTIVGILSNLGIVYMRENRNEEAVALHLEAAKIISPIARQNPDRQNDLAAIEDNLGLEYSGLRRFPESHLAFQEALAIRRSLALRDPARYEPDLSRTLTNMGVMSLEAGDLTASRKLLEESLALRRGLERRDPQMYGPSVAVTLKDLAIVYRDQGDTTLAEKALDEDLGIYVKLYQGDKMAYGRGLSDVYVALSQMHASEGETKTAISEMEDAARLRGELAVVSPLLFRQMTAQALTALAELYAKNGEADKAADAHRRAAALGGALSVRNVPR